MDQAQTQQQRVRRHRIAILLALVVPAAVSAALTPFRSSFPNTDAALALVLVVVAAAASGSRAAGMLAAVSDAVWFDFFLTRPYERFTINSRDDIETTVLLVVIGAALTELAMWGRRQQAAASEHAGYLSGLLDAAGEMSGGRSHQAAISMAGRQLTTLLGLASCVFERGSAGLGSPPRLERDGRVSIGSLSWDVDLLGLPPMRDSELLVESGGVLQGRFLMRPAPGSRPGREQRRIAAALVDQLGASLSRAA